MVFRLPAADLYEATPRQYDLMFEVHQGQQRHIEWQTGVIASAIANWSMGAPKEPMQPKDFPLPLLRGRESRPRINRKKIATDIRAAFDSASERLKAIEPKPPQ